MLRALQEGEIQPLGDERRYKVDVRLVCATHRPLEELVEQGLFREDLYYRINVFPVFIPPLRERPEDILPMVEHFIEMFSKEYGRPVRRVSTPAIDMLLAYHWPGNVRELRNVLERAALLTDGSAITAQTVEQALAIDAQPDISVATPAGTPATGRSTLRSMEDDILRAALRAPAGTRQEQARALGISPRTLYRKLRQLQEGETRFSQ